MSVKRTSYEPLAGAWRPSMFGRNMNASSLCGHGCVGNKGWNPEHAIPNMSQHRKMQRVIEGTVIEANMFAVQLPAGVN